MIHHVESYFLHAVSDTLDPETKIFLTVFVPTKAATAAIALSTLTFGAQSSGNGLRMGWGGCVIRKAGFSDKPGSTQLVPVAPSFERCELFLERCVFVTYQVSVAFGEAIALASLFVHDDMVVQAKMMAKRRHALVFDQKSGEVRTIHHLAALPGARVPSDRFLRKAIRDCASEGLSLSARSLAVAIHDTPAGFRHRANLRVDLKTGNLLGSESRRTGPVGPGRRP
jgi:hypothetical protein